MVGGPGRSDLVMFIQIQMNPLDGRSEAAFTSI